MILCLFLLGFVTWGLAFGRLAAWDARRTGWLVGIVLADELLGIGMGMWLARSGTWVDALACATGGACAAAVVMWRTNR